MQQALFIDGSLSGEYYLRLDYFSVTFSINEFFTSGEFCTLFGRYGSRKIRTDTIFVSIGIESGVKEIEKKCDLYTNEGPQEKSERDC